MIYFVSVVAVADYLIALMLPMLLRCSLLCCYLWQMTHWNDLNLYCALILVGQFLFLRWSKVAGEVLRFVLSASFGVGLRTVVAAAVTAVAGAADKWAVLRKLVCGDGLVIHYQSMRVHYNDLTHVLMAGY